MMTEQFVSLFLAAVAYVGYRLRREHLRQARVRQIAERLR
jgi:hypothetical protein